MEDIYKIEDKAKAIQQECHRTVEFIIKNAQTPVTVQDATNVFLYRKIAELEEMISSLQTPKQ